MSFQSTTNYFNTLRILTACEQICMYQNNDICYILSIQDGETALHKASGAGQTAVVKLLLDRGADVHAVTKVGDCSTTLGVFSHSCRGYLPFSLFNYDAISIADCYSIIITGRDNCSPLCQ